MAVSCNFVHDKKINHTDHRAGSYKTSCRSITTTAHHILRKENEPDKEEIMEPNAAKDNDCNITVEMEEEVKEEIEDSDE
ncbi:hypothetical protein Tco_0843774 [Tanacetum coccineum]